MSSRPTVSVLLPLYNGSQYLSAAVSSILQQTFTDFELLLLDDGSTDNGAHLLSSFKDPRARYFRSEHHLGVSKQLNIGLDEAMGPYLARMDADDVADPTRFQKQLSFLERHPEIGICGSYAQLFDDRGNREVWRYPTSPDEVHASVLFRAPFLHPGVMIRRALFQEVCGLRYDESLFVAQDYMLWHQLLKHTKGANLPECLTRYRISSAQLTRAKAEVKAKEGQYVRLSILRDLGIEPSASEQTLHMMVLGDNWPKTPEFFKSAAEWLEALYEANERSEVFPQRAFAKMLAKHFFFQCQCSSRRSFRGDRVYARLKFNTAYSPRLSEKLRLTAKALLKP